MPAGDIAYKIETLRMDLPPSLVDALLAQGTGGIKFDLEATAGGRFVFALYSPDHLAALASFSVQIGGPSVTRSLFLIPVAHTFNAPAELDMVPLGALLHTSGMFVLYEVIQDVGN